MTIRSLQLRAFRNYRSLDLSLDSEITVITGQNGIGKTSVLEAICLLGSGRSFRSAKNQDFILKGEEGAQIQGEIESSGLATDLKVRIYPQGKRIFVDEKLAKSTETLFTYLPTIVFSPGDHRIIEGDAADRKFFLNRAAANVDWEYVSDLNHYAKALLQRNRILKDAADQSWPHTRLVDLLQPWDEQVLLHGSRLVARRLYFLEELRPLAKEEYRKIAQTSDEFNFIYQPFGEDEAFSANTEDEIRREFEIRLKDSLRRDQIVASTRVGPHRDEILLTLNGNKAKTHASQGEKRTCALALRLGELALFRTKLNTAPVLLFDDVSSELDKLRRQSLVALLRKENTQVLITATELPSSLLGDVGKNFEQLDLQTVGDRD